mmetsp:Transcript_72324/g.203001  ORF Transcript_72324/g.203001 Transcript_72324/m.203001 type:complete len:260 (+) Transcript_72324:241-1020(+)
MAALGELRQRGVPEPEGVDRDLRRRGVLPLHHGGVVGGAPQCGHRELHGHRRRHLQRGARVAVLAPSDDVLGGHLEAVVRQASQVPDVATVRVPLDPDLSLRVLTPRHQHPVAPNLPHADGDGVVHRPRPADVRRGVVLDDGEHRGALTGQLRRRRHASDDVAPIGPPARGQERHLEKVVDAVVEPRQRQLPRERSQLHLHPLEAVVYGAARADAVRLVHGAGAVPQAPLRDVVLLGPARKDLDGCDRHRQDDRLRCCR